MKRLFEIYAMIPTFRCKPGCTDCCGPVPFARIEWQRIEDKRLATDMHCPYANDGCDIYDKRPLICRLFGTVKTPLLRCPHGCGPGRTLTKKQAHKLIKKYHKILEED